MILGRQLKLEWTVHQGRDCIAITGWSETELHQLAEADAATFSRRLAFYPSETLDHPGSLPSVPPVAGRLVVERDSLVFVPRFPLVAGMRYSLRFDSPDAGRPEVWDIQRPASPAETVATVVEIYPTAPEIPLNLLRLYVQFSHPMSEGWAARAITVKCPETDTLLDDVFLPPEPELWDADRRRLTMLLDPGRIKRGLIPNLESGYPLDDGMTVTVTVDPAFCDAGGRPLQRPAQRAYRVGPALRSRADPKRWRLTIPGARSTAPLFVDFDRPLDHGLLQHSLFVQDPAGSTVDGVASIGDSERSWSFTPASPWQPGEHQLVIEPRLEDVAGNNPVRVFDRDVSRTEDDPLPNVRTSLPFSCHN